MIDNAEPCPDIPGAKVKNWGKFWSVSDGQKSVCAPSREEAIRLFGAPRKPKPPQPVKVIEKRVEIPVDRIVERIVERVKVVEVPAAQTTAEEDFAVLDPAQGEPEAPAPADVDDLYAALDVGEDEVRDALRKLSTTQRKHFTELINVENAELRRKKRAGMPHDAERYRKNELLKNLFAVMGE